MRDNLQQNLKPCKQKTDAIAAITQQYWAEQVSVSCTITDDSFHEC